MALNRKIRRILFWVCVGLFLIVGSFLVVYSYGYRLNFDTWQFTQTGGLYVRTSPKMADIYLGDKPLDQKASLLSSGVLAKSIIPKTYQLTISKDGYFDWTKKIKIEAAMVNNFTHVVLLPKISLKDDFFAATSTSAIIAFKPITNGEEMILETRDKNKDGLYHSLSIFNKSKGTLLGVFQRKTTQNDGLNWMPNLVIDGDDANRIMISSLDKSSGRTTLYLWDRSEPDNISNFSQVLANYFSTKIIKVAFHPFEANKFLVQTSTKLAILDLDKKEVVNLPANNPTDFLVNGDDIFWIDKDASIFSYNLIFNNVSPIAVLDNPKGVISAWSISSNSKYTGVLFNNNQLVVVQAGQQPAIISYAATNFSFSLDNKKLAYSEKDGTIKVYFLEDLVQDIIKKASDKILIGNFGNGLDKFIWYKDSFHLLIKSGGKISFAEIDDRDKVNIFDFSFDAGNYWLDRSGLVFRLASPVIERINLAIGE